MGKVKKFHCIFWICAIISQVLGSNKSDIVSSLLNISKGDDPSKFNSELTNSITKLDKMTTEELEHDKARLKAYKPKDIKSEDYRLPIVYVFTVSKVFCEYGLPEYIKHSLIQSVMSQHDADVTLVGNFNQCPKLKQHTDLLDGVKQVDSEKMHHIE